MLAPINSIRSGGLSELMYGRLLRALGSNNPDKIIAFQIQTKIPDGGS